MVKEDIKTKKGDGGFSTQEYFDDRFVTKVAKMIITYPDTFRAIAPIFDQNCFSRASMRAIMGIIKDCYRKNKRVPSPDEIVMVSTTQCNKQMQEEILSDIMIIRSESTEDGEAAMKLLKDFFTLKHLLKMSNKIIESAFNNDNPEKIINDYRKEYGKIEVMDTKEAIDVVATVDNMMVAATSTENTIIPTGIGRFDSNIGGGLKRREIGMFIAPTGGGKTTVSTIFAQNAAKSGFRVLQCEFEDEPENLLLKHLSMYSGKYAKDIRSMTDGERAATVNDFCSQKWLDNLKILKFNVGELTAEDLDAKIGKLIDDENFQPDLVIIDYFDCLKHTTNQMRSHWEAQARCMRKLKAIAERRNIGMWVMQQTNRNALKKENKEDGMANVQGSFQITQPASVVLMLSITNAQRKENKADVIFAKSRHTLSENLYNIEFNNGLFRIDTTQTEEDDPLAFNMEENEFGKNGYLR